MNLFEFVFLKLTKAASIQIFFATNRTSSSTAVVGKLELIIYYIDYVWLTPSGAIFCGDKEIIEFSFYSESKKKRIQ